MHKHMDADTSVPPEIKSPHGDGTSPKPVHHGGKKRSKGKGKKMKRGKY